MRRRHITAWVLLIAISGLAVFSIGAAAQGPENAEAYNQRGQALMAAEEFEEAIKVFKQAIALKPDFTEAFYHLGDSYMEVGEVKKAVGAYQEVIKHKPDSAEAYEHLGAAYEANRD